jgi:SAM-dependent methyltransferase
MSGFSHGWLALREEADSAARDSVLTSTLAAGLPTRPGLRIVDLGAGTGANLRYLAPRLGRNQEWWLIDHDAALLARIEPLLFSWARMRGYRASKEEDALVFKGSSFQVRARWIPMDLGTSLADLSLGEVHLVTASALLDLVSREWIDSLSRACRQNACAALFSLNYDGRIEWRPALTKDVEVRGLLNRHQCRDKGLGPALGPTAAAYAAKRFAALGYQVQTAESDWRLGAAQAPLQQALAANWVQSAVELDPATAVWVEAWLRARTRHIQQGTSRLTVGHTEILALPLPKP